MMMVSTKGRYALRVMIDLAEHGNGKYIAMKSVAERQEISLKYLEKILRSLVSATLIEGYMEKAEAIGLRGPLRSILSVKSCSRQKEVLLR